MNLQGTWAYAAHQGVVPAVASVKTREVPLACLQEAAELIVADILEHAPHLDVDVAAERPCEGVVDVCITSASSKRVYLSLTWNDNPARDDAYANAMESIGEEWQTADGGTGKIDCALAGYMPSDWRAQIREGEISEVAVSKLSLVDMLYSVNCYHLFRKFTIAELVSAVA